MPGLSLDGKKNKQRKKRERKHKEVVHQEPEIIPEEPEKEEEVLGTYSVLDSIELDISDAEDDCPNKFILNLLKINSSPALCQNF